MNCLNCGKEISAGNAKYCSRECQMIYVQNAREDVGSRHREKRNEMYALTPYLCQKWKAEGFTEKQIAKILDCTVDLVERALQVPLSKMQQQRIKTFFNPKRR